MRPKVSLQFSSADEDLHLLAFNSLDIRLWLTIESPKGVLHCNELAQADSRIEALVLGTSDLSKVRDRKSFYRILTHLMQRRVADVKPSQPWKMLNRLWRNALCSLL